MVFLKTEDGFLDRRTGGQEDRMCRRDRRFF